MENASKALPTARTVALLAFERGSALSVTGVHEVFAMANRLAEATSVKLAASQCGFRSADHFRRAFHRRFGISPQDYRERFRSTGILRLPQTGGPASAQGTVAQGAKTC